MTRAFDPVLLGSIELFCKAAETTSFTATAHAMGVTPAAVSRSIGRLETRLGVRLFARTTRQIRLTEDGQLYFDQCRQALAQIADVERVIGGHREVPTGLLRISVPTTYGHHRVLPLLPRFAELYPDVQIDLDISNRNINLIDEGFDLAIRAGEPQDSRLVARKLEDATMGIYASPDYLARRGTPRNLQALARHDCVRFVMPSTGKTIPWLVSHAGPDGRADIDITVSGRVKVREDILGCINYAKAGGGLVQAYHFIVQKDLQRGELVEVLRKHSGRSRPFCVVYPQNRHLSAKVRSFVDFMVSQIQPSAA